jgi:hypothetical protein
MKTNISMPGTFGDAEPNYHRRSARRDVPKPDCHAATGMQATDIHDDDMLLATPILYGFSLAKKLWRSYIMF